MRERGAPGADEAGGRGAARPEPGGAPDLRRARRGARLRGREDPRLFQGRTSAMPTMQSLSCWSII